MTEGIMVKFIEVLQQEEYLWVAEVEKDTWVYIFKSAIEEPNNQCSASLKNWAFYYYSEREKQNQIVYTIGGM